MDVEELQPSAINPQTRQCLQLQWNEFDMKELWDTQMGILKMEEYKIG